MDTTTNNKTNIGADTQIMDWAKPYYNVSPNTATQQVQLKSPQEVITVDSLKQVPDLKLPKTAVQNPVVSEVVSTTQPSIQQAQQELTQVQQAVGTEAKDAQKALQDLALNVFGQKAQAQAGQVDIENQLGLQEQQKALSQINTEIANEQLGLRGEEEKLRQSFGSEAQKAIRQNTLNDTYGRRLADLAIRQSAANQNIAAIQTNAERQTKLLTAPLDTKIQYLSTFAKDNVDYLNDEQKTKVAFLTNNLESQKKDIQALQSAKTQMIMEIAKNGGGTNQNLIRQIQNASSVGEVSTLGAGSGFIGSLDRQQLAIAKANLAINQAELKMKIDAAKPIDVSKLVVDQNAPATTKNNAVMMALLKTGKVGEGARTVLSGVLGVNKAIEDLANARQYKEFKGISPANTILDAKIPFTNIGIPFRNATLSAEAVQNKGYLDAINLKVQQWASGASLTPDQTKKVNSLVPGASDTDAIVRTKMNNLTNFMNQQVSGTLASQGIDFRPETVNLFENRELYNKASPEQKAELDKIINQ